MKNSRYKSRHSTFRYNYATFRWFRCFRKINDTPMSKKPMCIILSAVGQDKITQKQLV